MTDALQQARSLFLEGNRHFSEDRLPQALACFQAAAALAPGRPSVQANLGVTLSLLGRGRAIRSIQQSPEPHRRHCARLRKGVSLAGEAHRSSSPESG